MVGNAERIGSTDENLQTSQNKHPLEDMPPFDLEAAKRQVEETVSKLHDHEKQSRELDYVWGDPSEEYDDYGVSDSVRSLEKSKACMRKYERILSDPNLLKTASRNYLEQYQPESKSRADILFTKNQLDHYIVSQLSGENAKDFINSEQFENYCSYIIDTARQKVQIINGKQYYPELVTNPVLSNPEYRRLVISKLRPADRVDEIMSNLAKNESGYRGFLKYIENRLETRCPVSQGELDMVGDYLYTGRDFDSGLAKKFACYMFNEATQRQDLKSSTQIGGALANYFAYKDTLDDRLKDRHVIIANSVGWDSRNNRPAPVRTGVSTPNYCVLEQKTINDMSLSSEEGLSKSRPETITDLYSLMMASFHELTHDYQRLMAADGNDNSSAMAHILNQVLRRNQSECFPKVDKDLNKEFDENGREVKTGYYQANHDSDEIEIQADEEAWRQCRKFIHEHEVDYSWDKKDEAGKMRAHDHWSKCMDNEQEVRTRRAFALKVDENGQEMPYIKYDIEQLGASIKRDPDIIKQYPQLSEFFDESGLIKPDIFFSKEIASVDIDAIDTITDDFGVEIATYALMDWANVENILSYIRNPNNNLSEAQVKRCLSNLWNVLYQDVLKTRPLKKTNFGNYSETKTRGKNTSIEVLRESYLKQYLHQLYNCTYIAETLKTKYPQMGGVIEHKEQAYFISFYSGLAKDVVLPAGFSKRAREHYLKTENEALRQIAIQL